MQFLAPRALYRQHVGPRLGAQLETGHHLVPLGALPHEGWAHELADVVGRDPQGVGQPVTGGIAVQGLAEHRYDLSPPLGLQGEVGHQLELDHQARHL